MDIHIERITANHDTDVFDCGARQQNDYLRKYALLNLELGYAVTYVAVDSAEDRIAGFFTLSASTIAFENISETFVDEHGSLPRYPAPTILLGQLGVDTDYAGEGLGKALVGVAVEKAVAASETVGAVAIQVHAGHEDLVAWYERMGFVQAKDRPEHLFLSMKVARDSVDAA
jgi:GNAT superfamily N-acetyltransferase